ATIAPVVTGTLVDVRVRLGSTVRAGDVLARISARQIDARLEQTKAVRAQAKLDRDRAAALHAQAALSPAQYDAAESQLRVAESAEAEASSMAEHTILRAPFAGIVTGKTVNVGDTAMPGQALFTLENPAALRFEARVPETASPHVAIGDSMPLRIDGI